METVLLNPNDSVEVIVSSNDAILSPGTKLARLNIKEGQPVIKYGVPIGTARFDIAQGARVDHRVMKELLNPSFEITPDVTEHGTLPTDQLTFEGYATNSGAWGTRNYLCIATSVHCVSGIADYAAERIRKKLLPAYPNVDGVVLLNHTYGCGVAIDSNHSEIPRRTLANLMLNPNFGGYTLLLGLGCEKLRHELMLQDLAKDNGDAKLECDSLYFQDVDARGFEAIVSEICNLAENGLRRLNTRQRKTTSISNLIVGSQCGGSDAFSGITANPTIGRVSDVIVDAGGTTIFSESTECMDAQRYLVSRCIDQRTGDLLIREFDWYRDYLSSHGVDRTANTTPGNKSGGLSTITEKALGSIAKSGSAKIVDVISPGGRARKQGLNFLSGPASDFICGTLELAAGANIHLFSTGRGTPYSIDGFPVIKIGTNSQLKIKWFDLIDFDAGKVALGQTLNESAILLIKEMQKVASGHKTAAERLGISNDLVLFNPAAIT